MSQRAKGFTLIELLVTVSLVGILAAIAIPSFTSAIQSSKSDTEISDLQRALNYARLEAINRGVSVRVLPAVTGGAWNSALKVVLSSAVDTPLRDVAAMSSGATVTATNVTFIEFNSLGGLSSPSTNVTMTYALGSISKVINVCLIGRINVGGVC